MKFINIIVTSNGVLKQSHKVDYSEERVKELENRSYIRKIQEMCDRDSVVFTIREKDFKDYHFYRDKIRQYNQEDWINSINAHNK